MSRSSGISSLERIASALERAVAIMVEVHAEDRGSAPATAPNSAMVPCPAFMVGCTHDLCPFQKTCGDTPCMWIARNQ